MIATRFDPKAPDASLAELKRKLAYNAAFTRAFEELLKSSTVTQVDNADGTTTWTFSAPIETVPRG